MATFPRTFGGERKVSLDMMWKEQMYWLSDDSKDETQTLVAILSG